MNKKRGMSGLQNVGVILAVLIALFFIIGVNNTALGKTNDALDRLDLDRHLGVRLESAVEFNEDLFEPIPEPYLVYATNLATTLFRDATLENDFVSELYFFEPFVVEDMKDYEHLRINIAYYTRLNGLAVYIHNLKTGEDLTLFGADQTDWLLGKKLCVLPEEDDDSENAKLVLAEVLEIPIEGRKITSDTSQGIIKENSLEFVSLGFNRRVSEYATISPFASKTTYFDIYQNQQTTPIFIYDSNNNAGIPYVVLDNTVCFFGVSEEYSRGDPVVIGESRASTDIRGNGYVWDGTVSFIQTGLDRAKTNVRVHINQNDE